MAFWRKLFRLREDSTIKFVRRYTESRDTPVGQVKFKYEVYRATTAQEARNFLESKTVSQPFSYILVETSEGNWGKDINGLYKED